MTWIEWYVITVLAIPLGLALVNRLRADTAALIIAAALGAGQFAGWGVLGPPDSPDLASRAIAGFGQPVVLTLISLFIITQALDKVGITQWLAQRLLSIGGTSERRLVALFAVTVALLSLVMNSVAAGALLLPSAMDVARRSGIKPSRLLMPISFASLLGGMATFFTTANIIVSDLLVNADPPQTPLGVLAFTPTGGLIALAGIAFIAFFARYLLPERATLVENAVPRPTESELEDYYEIGERLWEVRVPSNSVLDGQTLGEARIGEQSGAVVAAVLRGRRSRFAPSPNTIVHSGDTLLMIGREDVISAIEGVELLHNGSRHHISESDASLIEVIPAPHSNVSGHTLKELDFRKQYGCTAVAVWHEGRSYRTGIGEIKLNLGDSFLVLGQQSCVRKLQNSASFIVLEPNTRPEAMDTRGAVLAGTITVGAVAASILGVPTYLAMLIGALLLFLTRVLTLDEVYQSMHWQAIFLIAGMYSVSVAMVQTGLADHIGEQMVTLVTPFGPLGLAAGCFLFTALLTQIMGGQVTALVTGPVAISAALSLGTDPHAIAVATAIGCSAAFLTPVAHPINILVMGPANYRFADFARFGAGLMVVCTVMIVVGMKIFWGL
ncbi:SLC13 family permease [Aggregatilinea lenta]|uniref:SLC13 family permease n=1 Tax=Aggregatilinea lenta TaxID=913108 RepID=UPI000E5C5404|nr:SLC13 family permease [Aggregatilinea lenta]